MKRRLKELIEELMPDYKVRINTNKSKVKLIKKSLNIFNIFNLFCKRRTLSIIELLLIDIPTRMSYYRYGNYSFSHYYRTQIINKLNDCEDVTESTIYHIINMFFKEMINSDFGSDEFNNKFNKRINKSFNGKNECLKNNDFFIDVEICENSEDDIVYKKFISGNYFKDLLTKKALIFSIVLLITSCAF